MQEWIAAVGSHTGMIPGSTWISVQETLERNASRAYGRPRSNEALLTGVLFCSCGNRMYPKLTERKDAQGKRIYTYICSLKERSRKACCDRKNAMGNRLDLEVLEALQKNVPEAEGFSLEEKRKLVREQICRVEWDGASARILYREEGEKVSSCEDSK